MTSRHSLQNPAYASTSASSSSLSQTSLPVLADPPIRLADAAALDYLIIEMTHTLRASSAVASARVKRIEREMVEAGFMPEPPDKASLAKEKEKERLKKEQRESGGSAGTRASVGPASGLGKSNELDEEEEGLRIRLEAIGVHIGGNVAERCVINLIGIGCLVELTCRLCRDRPRFGDTLDAVKFICKDVWSTCWDKQVDNLRTNHRVCLLYILIYMLD